MTDKKDFSDEELKTVLQEHGIQPTALRLELLAYLLCAGGHPTREEIHAAVCQPESKCSLASIYNIINLFTEKGLLLSIRSGDNYVRYDAALSPHGHFHCSKCNEIWNVPVNLDLERLSQLKGFRCDSSEIVIHGVCPECQKKKD